ncbi:allene oxide cyclase family protein [Dongia soli]|uniref:allene-oxide cyclase n=1 Tax=Dongia soli TaxID=600628 RepID=A0ABU5EEA6_9PROT|nr:allene oxide cyclase family protein [Dongia soli]MDY0884558.1 allene oxide cyclase family protein [Dongia soli]
MTKLLAGLAGLGAALAIGFLTTATARAEMTIVVVERATTDAVTDLGAKGDSAGDLLTFANDIYDEQNGKKIGTDNGWCIRTVAGKAWECFWTISLPKGQITVQGPFYDAGDSVLAVTGGTGSYTLVRGQMGLHARDDKGSEYDFKYSLR